MKWKQTVLSRDSELAFFQSSMGNNKENPSNEVTTSAVSFNVKIIEMENGLTMPEMLKIICNGYVLFMDSLCYKCRMTFMHLLKSLT